MAQYPYQIVVLGNIVGCYPGQTVNIQTVQGTQPAYNYDVPVDPNTCTFFTVLGVSSNPAWVVASTQCNGQVITFADSAHFNFIQDSAFVQFTMICGGGGTYDCTGILNGPNMPGTACNDGDPMTFNDVWTPNCVCTGTDTSVVYDCLQIPNGPNVPGAWCTTFMGDTGIWSANCMCIPDTNFVLYDCLGIPNGPNMPGLACDDNDPMTTYSYWTLDCICAGDSGSYYDCLQIPNGPNVPGSPCTAFGVVGTWNSQCMCVPNNPDPCQADFWVIQAMGNDSLPVPYEVWVWNLTSGGSGVYTYLWSFGDGTSSTEAYPTHSYSGNGPYNLCLTIADNAGCTSTHCDTVSIDANGIYNGMAGNGGDRQDGFTINVRNPLTTSINEVATLTDVALWPNPANELVNVAVNSTLSGSQQVTVTDLNGRVVISERHNLNGGRTQFTLNTTQLPDGIYMVRLGNTDASQRFVKTH